MGLEADRQTIETLLSNNWVTTDIAWDGVDYTPVAGTSWISLTILSGEDQSSTMTKYNQIGLLVIQIFTPEHTGSATARGYADTLSGIFRNAVQSGINFKLPTTTRVGISNGWYQMNVSVPYHRLSSL
ncbi:MAG TPA: hypothetical protein HPP64_13575 [Gammaproteobacteria bacterium]|jgi:hypothetical protein|nr:hypothetical protein [Gammaproteobacteria bacterium]